MSIHSSTFQGLCTQVALNTWLTATGKVYYITVCTLYIYLLHTLQCGPVVSTTPRFHCIIVILFVTFGGRIVVVPLMPRQSHHHQYVEVCSVCLVVIVLIQEKNVGLAAGKKRQAKATGMFEVYLSNYTLNVA